MKHRIVRPYLFLLICMFYVLPSYSQFYFLDIEGNSFADYSCNPFEDNAADIYTTFSNTGNPENWKSSHGSPGIHENQSGTWFAQLDALPGSFENNFEQQTEGIYIPYNFETGKGYDITIAWQSTLPAGSYTDALLLVKAANGLTEDTDSDCTVESAPNVTDQVILTDTPMGFIEGPYTTLLASINEYVPNQNYDYLWLTIAADFFDPTQLRIDDVEIIEFDIVTGPGGTGPYDDDGDELFVGTCDNYFPSNNEILEIGSTYSFYHHDSPSSVSEYTLELYYAGGTYTVLSEQGTQGNCLFNDWEFTMPEVQENFNWLRNEQGNILGRIYVTNNGEIEDMINMELVFNQPNIPQLTLTSSTCSDDLTDVSFYVNAESPNDNLVYTATINYDGNPVTQTSIDGHFTFLNIPDCEQIHSIEVFATNSSNASSYSLFYDYNYCDNGDEECYMISCEETSSFYQVLNGTDFYTYDPSTQTYDLIHVNDYSINAIGYNIEDGFIYGIMDYSNHLVRVGSNGVYNDLGEVIDLPSFSSGSYYIGDFDLSGNLFVSTGSFVAYQIDVSAMQATTIGFDFINLGNQNLQISDFSYLATESKFYALNANSSLISFDPNTGDLENLGLTNPVISCANYGASYSDINDDLYFFCNSTGNIYKVDYTDLSISLFQETGEILAINDGASCALSSLTQDSCLTIINEDFICNTDQTVSYSFDFVYNNSNNATNFFITDSDNMILENIGGLDLNSGDTYSTVTFDIPTTESEFCFRIRMFGDEECCHLEYCVEVPDCSDCLIVSNEEVTCEGDGSFNYSFTIQNSTEPSHDATDLRIVPLQSGICIDGFEAPAMIPFTSPFSQGETANTSINISDCGVGVQAGDLIPFQMILIDNAVDLDWCCHSDTIWVPVPHCNNNDTDCGGCDSLITNVQEGFNFSRAQHFCIKDIIPQALEECDSVVWTVNDIEVGTSIGNTPFQYDFGSPSPNYNVCMTVYRTDEDGSICTQNYCTIANIECTEYDLNEQLNISFYPNPTTSVLNYTIKNLRNRKIESIEVINAIGKRTLINNTKAGPLSETGTINVNTMKTGTYFLRVSLNDGEELVQRFIKI